MRRRQQAIAEQRLEHEAFLQQRRRQQEEAFRRNKAKQNALHHLREKQQQGYQIVQDWDGQLYLVPPYSSSDDTEYRYYSDTDDNFSNVPVQEDRKTIPINASTVRTTTQDINVQKGFLKKTENSNISLKNESNVQGRKQPTVLVEDVSDSEDDVDDISATLERTLRNRRPSPGQWLEPVEIMS
jgi:hypothetical protein